MKLMIVMMTIVVLCSPVLFAQIGAVKATSDERVKRLLDKLELKYVVDKDGDFKLIMKLAHDRTQLVFVNSNTEKFRNMEIREVWSVAYLPSDGIISESVALNLLRANTKMKLGAWQIQRIGGKDAAAFTVKLAADTDAETLNAIMVYVSEAADEKENELTQTDDL